MPDRSVSQTHREHPAVCPNCGEPAIPERTLTWAPSSGVTEAAFLCSNKHGWTTKWVTAA